MITKVPVWYVSQKEADQYVVDEIKEDQSYAYRRYTTAAHYTLHGRYLKMTFTTSHIEYNTRTLCISRICSVVI